MAVAAGVAAAERTGRSSRTGPGAKLRCPEEVRQADAPGVLPGGIPARRQGVPRGRRILPRGNLLKGQTAERGSRRQAAPAPAAGTAAVAAAEEEAVPAADWEGRAAARAARVR